MIGHDDWLYTHSISPMEVFGMAQRLSVVERSQIEAEVCLSLPRRWGVESNLSFGFFGVVESGLSVVVEPGLAGLL